MKQETKNDSRCVLPVIFDRYFSRFLQYNANSLRVLEIDDEFSYNSDINERLMKGV